MQKRMTAFDMPNMFPELELAREINRSIHISKKIISLVSREDATSKRAERQEIK